MERRAFLAGLMAAPAIVRAESLMKLAAPPRLILWGDGIHDDTDALQAVIDGRRVWRPDGHELPSSGGPTVYLPAGFFAYSRPIWSDVGKVVEGAGADQTVLFWSGNPIHRTV